MGLGSALSGIAQGLGAAAGGFTPAMGDTLARRQQDRQANARLHQQQVQHDDLMDWRTAESASDANYREATLAANEAQAQRDQAYRMAGRDVENTRYQLELQRVRNAAENNNPASKRAMAAAEAVQEWFESRPVMDIDLTPQEFELQMQGWREYGDAIPGLYGFDSLEDIGMAQVGPPANKNPIASGQPAAARDAERGANRYGEALQSIFELRPDLRVGAGVLKPGGM